MKKIRRLFFSIHKLLIKLKIHILPVHYYSPVPDILELQRNKDLWAYKSDLPGISFNLDEQVNNLKNVCNPFHEEFEGNQIYNEAVSEHFGQGFGYIEAQALHSFIRYYKPKRIIELGSGVSTYCMLSALNMNEKEISNDSKIYSVEPYPSNALKNIANNNAKIDLIHKKAQKIPLDFFLKLKSNDILFIDSSHTVKPGSDVNYLILEILPRLNKGVIVHFHDIYLPYDYQIDVLQTIFHWAETSLLRAFLINNDKVEIIASLSQLHYDRRDELKEIFPEYDPQNNIDGLVDPDVKPFEFSPKHFPASTYIKIL